MNVNFLKEIAEEINNLKLSDDFKDFSSETFLVFILCKMYEEMKNELITTESLSKKSNILDFIRDLKPIIEKMGIMVEINKNVLKGLIKELYIPHVRLMMMDN